ncbi:hypothetical protein [Ruegeria meonggei]|uniref:Antitoxin Xre/MbcA/ParS-like toxin-binding domain-containing protein n=1 Tax=Ruegeria meonggei TaxID=1446476 RepID=A0A1X7ACA2_9RHOB|nr:hypothetical protein [Ruegeria meonggei]SLN75676.1 hypothetical protein RUM8411_04251 [Ruegeria meonggei]
MYMSKFDDRNDVASDSRKTEFARKYPLLDDASVHAQWKNGSWQITRIGDIWSRTGKVLSVRFEGADAYPSFQFSEDGTPLPLMEKVLSALPCEMSPWQCAFWVTSPKKELDGESPVSCIQTGDARVIDLAGRAGAIFNN